ncbi:carbonic anhydrase, partial [Bacillus thuringiensis]|nr:carbonic anhydrase [Bacillus thuringiensis]
MLIDIENGIEAIIQQITNVQRENMLTIRSYYSVIAHPYGDIVRSV